MLKGSSQGGNASASEKAPIVGGMPASGGSSGPDGDEGQAVTGQGTAPSGKRPH